MEVYIVPPSGTTFPLEVGLFETVEEIKHRIETSTGIPVPNQTLHLNGEVLHDDGTAMYVGITEKSYIHLQADTTQSESSKVRLHIKTPSSPSLFLVEADRDDTVRSLKEKIQAERETSVPVGRLSLEVFGIELQDDLSIYESGLIDDAEINVVIKPPLLGSSRQGTPRSGSTGSGKLLVRVLPWQSKMKLVIEVNKNNNVEVLRGELEKLQVTAGFELPGKYFFIHKQDTMEEYQTFQWHGVEQGDTITIFPGEITFPSKPISFG